MKTRTRLIVILGLVILSRIFFIMLFKTYAHPQLWEYEEIANNLLAGKGYLFNHLGGVPYRSFNNPLYGFLSAGIYSITGHSYFALLVVQALFSALLVYTVFLIGRLVFSEKLGYICAVLVAFHPALAYYDVFNLLPFSIDTFFIALSTLVFLKYHDHPSLKKMSVVGGLIGLGMLSRGIIGAMLPFFSVYTLIFLKTPKLLQKTKLIFAMFFLCAIVISPWIIRNYALHKEVLLISTTGETFWRGNNQHASGTSLSREGIPIIDLFPREFKDKIYALDEIGQKRFFEKEAITFIRNNPGRFLELYLRKFFYFWWFSPQTGILYPKAYFLIYKYLYLFILIFAIYGFASALKSWQAWRKESARIVLIVCAAISLSQSLFYSEGRHRFLVEPLLIIFFTGGISDFYNRYLKTQLSRKE